MKKGKLKSSDMVNLARTFLSGGTNFALPLDQAINVINESRFKQADVVFVTDGEDSLKDSFLVEFNKKKKEKNFNVLSLMLGSSINTVEQFSDKVVKFMILMMQEVLLHLKYKVTFEEHELALSSEGAFCVLKLLLGEW